jgi:hypothetical protein
VLEAVVELTDEPVEQVPLRGGVTISVFLSPAVVLASRLAVRGCGERPDPSGGSQSVVLDRRWVMEMEGPDARVMGADPAWAFSARASANRVRSSPISATTRAPVESAKPRKLVMIV